MEDTLGLGVIPLQQGGFLPGMDQVLKTTETLAANGKESNWGKLTTAKWVSVGIPAELPIPETPVAVGSADVPIAGKNLSSGEVRY